jgi:DNA invertase Pin-like site-specific DNA recombinase
MTLVNWALATIAAYLRLSRDDEDSTSIAQQDDVTTAFAATHGGTITRRFVDDGVSGKVPFERRTPDGMPALLDAIRNREVNVVIARKSDRFARDETGALMSQLANMCRVYGVELWTVEEGALLDADGELTSTAKMGGFMAGMFLADMTRKTRDAKAQLRKQGRWGNGAPPYGYVVVPATKHGVKGKYLVPDEEETRPGTGTAPRVREMVRRVVAGTRVQTLVDELNDAGVLSPADRARVLYGGEPRGTRWTVSVVRDLLTSYRLLGYQVYDPRSQREKRDEYGNRVKLKPKDLAVLYGEDGRPVMVTLNDAGLIDAETFALVRDTIGSRATRPTTYTTGTLLKGLVVCDGCGRAAHHNARKDRSASWRCKTPGCPARVVVADGVVAPVVTARFLETWGDVTLWRDVTESDNGAHAALDDAEARLAVHTAALDKVSPGSPAFEAVLDRITAVSNEVAALRERVATSKTVRRVYDTATLGERWHAAEDDGQRRALLRELGTVARVGTGKGAGRVRVSFTSEFADHILSALSAADDVPDARQEPSMQGVHIRI